MMGIRMTKNVLKNIIQKVLNEAMMSGFSVGELKSRMDDDMGDMRGEETYSHKINHVLNRGLEYCQQMLGQPIGEGSSRFVFQIDDTRVLKLAINYKGIHQNKEEVTFYNKCPNKVFMPIIYQDSDVEDFYYIISEYVLPADKEDFVHLLGFQFVDVCKLIFGDAELMGNAKNQPIGQLRDYVETMAKQGVNIADWTNIDNWGLAKRNGKAFLVTLDNGFTREIASKFYREPQKSFVGSKESAKKLGYGSDYHQDEKVYNNPFGNKSTQEIGRLIVSWVVSTKNGYYYKLMTNVAKKGDNDLLYELMGEYVECNMDGIDPWEDGFDFPKEVYEGVMSYIKEYVSSN